MSGPTCACSIERAISAIFASRKKRIPAALLVRIRAAEDAGADDRAFEDHMQIEEEYLFPELPLEFQRSGLYEHNFIRGYRSRGEKVPETIFHRHAEWEKDMFSRITSKFIQLQKAG